MRNGTVRERWVLEAGMVEGERIGEWLSRLVRIPSVNPAQAGPRAREPGEAAIIEWLADRLGELGGELHWDEVQPGRHNLYALFRGTSGRWIGIDTHVDTVGVEQMVGDPFSGEIRDGRVYGRGAVDTKASLGVILALLEAMREQGLEPEPNLLIAATVDEEVTAYGAPAFARWVRAHRLELDQLAVSEPTQCGPVIAHKGGLRVAFTIHGKASHSAQPELGENAIVAAAELIRALQEEHERLQDLPTLTPLGSPTLTVTMVDGGTGANVVPARCCVGTDRRLIPGEEPDEVAKGIIAIAREQCPLPFDSEVNLKVSPFFQPSDTPWVEQLADWSGRPPAVVPFCTNAWAYEGLAKECAVLGPGCIDQAHGREEWVEITELEKMAGIYGRWWLRVDG